MLLSFVCVKIRWIVCCRWIRATADACFAQSVKHDKLDFCALVWKRTSNSYNISSFWISSIQVDKCLRTYYKLSWKYVNKAEIISRVTITLSLINSNKDFAFDGWVISNTCVMYRKSYERECITWYMGTSDVLKVFKIARAAGECNLRTWKTSRVTIYSYFKKGCFCDPWCVMHGPCFIACGTLWYILIVSGNFE